jgi:AcrR family transcriptional regulator
MSYFPAQILQESNTKAKIFKAAARLFSEKGYNGVSMREICEHAGLSKPTIYYHFGSKEGIFTALVDAGLHHNLEIFQAIANKSVPIKQKITELVKIRFQQVLEYPELAKFFLMLFSVTEVPVFLRQYVEEASRRRKLLVDLIKEGVQSKEFGPSANPELAAEIFLGAIFYFITKQIHSREKILSDVLAEQIVELLFKGLNE